MSSCWNNSSDILRGIKMILFVICEAPAPLCYPVRTQNPPRGLQKPAPCDWSMSKFSQSKTTCFVLVFCYWLDFYIDQSQGAGFWRPRGGLYVLAGYRWKLKCMLTNSASFCIDGLLLRYEKWARRVWRGLQFTDFTICGFKERHSSTGEFVKSRCHDIKK